MSGADKVSWAVRKRRFCAILFPRFCTLRIRLWSLPPASDYLPRLALSSAFKAKQHAHKYPGRSLRGSHKITSGKPHADFMFR